MKDTQRSSNISTQLRQIAEQAKQYPELVFTSLIHQVDVGFLTEAYYRLRRDGAPGLSGVTAKDYGKDLEANLIDLHQRLKGQSYEAPPIKRIWIDKEGGKKRPIGLSEVEDKIVQKAVSMLMGAVYEQNFYSFSYGFREGCSAHQAIGAIREQCMKLGINWILDCDISGFFYSVRMRLDCQVEELMTTMWSATFGCSGDSVVHLLSPDHAAVRRSQGGTGRLDLTAEVLLPIVGR